MAQDIWDFPEGSVCCQRGDEAPVRSQPAIPQTAPASLRTQDSGPASFPLKIEE